MQTSWLAFTVLLAAFAASLSAADISGKWTFQVETSQGSGSPTFVLKQEGEKLSGIYKGLFGERPVTGTVKGNDVAIQIKVDVEGTSATVTYTGQIESATSMKGKVLLGEFEGTWTAKKD